MNITGTGTRPPVIPASVYTLSISEATPVQTSIFNVPVSVQKQLQICRGYNVFDLLVSPSFSPTLISSYESNSSKTAFMELLHQLINSNFVLRLMGDKAHSFNIQTNSDLDKAWISRISCQNSDLRCSIWNLIGLKPKISEEVFFLENLAWRFKQGSGNGHICRTWPINWLFCPTRILWYRTSKKDQRAFYTCQTNSQSVISCHLINGLVKKIIPSTNYYL